MGAEGLIHVARDLGKKNWAMPGGAEAVRDVAVRVVNVGGSRRWKGYVPSTIEETVACSLEPIRLYPSGCSPSSLNNSSRICDARS
jgi:hypothetical protein